MTQVVPLARLVADWGISARALKRALSKHAIAYYRVGHVILLDGENVKQLLEATRCSPCASEAGTGTSAASSASARLSMRSRSTLRERLRAMQRQATPPSSKSA